jgi:hypothetical protein
MPGHESEDQTSSPTPREPDISSGIARNGKYKVGYGRPPDHTRFKPGESGNAKGRPAGSPNAKTTIARIINEKVPVREGEKTRQMTKLEALIQSHAMKGMKGDVRSAGLVIDLVARTGLLADQEQATLEALPSEDRLDFNQIPLERLRRFRDLLRKAIDPTALSHDELDELKEIKLSSKDKGMN